MRADGGVAIGVLTNVERTANSSLLKIDAWNVSVSLDKGRTDC